MALGKAQRACLEFVRDNGTVHLWPFGLGMSRKVRENLTLAGYLETTAVQTRGWPMVGHRITDSGLSALTAPTRREAPAKELNDE